LPGGEKRGDVNLRPIERIKVGDRVLSRSDRTRETAYKPVTDLIRPHHRRIYAVRLEQPATHLVETFDVTDDHPWRSIQGRWLTTLQLKSGAQIQTAHGPGVKVVSVVLTPRVTDTYNLEVGEFHTFFVGEEGVWVHNADCGRILGNLAGRASEVASDVARSRGATGTVVRQMGHWADKTLGEIAQATAKGDRSAATAMKIIKQSARLGQNY